MNKGISLQIFLMRYFLTATIGFLCPYYLFLEEIILRNNFVQITTFKSWKGEKRVLVPTSQMLIEVTNSPSTYQPDAQRSNNSPSTYQPDAYRSYQKPKYLAARCSQKLPIAQVTTSQMLAEVTIAQVPSSQMLTEVTNSPSTYQPDAHRSYQ